MHTSKFINPTQTDSWAFLTTHYKKIIKQPLISFFEADDSRANKYSFHLEDLFVDISKNHFNDETIKLLIEFAHETTLKEQIDALFNADKINTTEHQAALHWALRSNYEQLANIDKTIATEIKTEFEKVEDISENIRNQSLLGYSGKPINTVVNIGIGGSDLGPRLVCDALKAYATDAVKILFISNADRNDLDETLKQCDPETTLFIVASKSFGTLETKMNAESARGWITDHGCSDLSKHFIAITANRKAAIEFGINENQILSFGSWVGGRYSLWSTIGLPIAIAIGMNGFQQLLHGANLVDTHFKHTELSHNIPVLLALLDIWYRNFFNFETLTIVPYDHYLKLLPDYLSQLMMESNGKNIDRLGKLIDYQTSPIVWGSVGTNAQHAFFQQLHQGSSKTSIDFFISINGSTDNKHQQALFANCIAQSEALMVGQTTPSEEEPYRYFEGNRPSSTFVYEQLTPKVLGMILAIYEHRTYVQACLYNINAFDQWGVELGKKLSTTISEELSKNTISEHDGSTRNLLNQFLSKRSST